MDENVKGDTPKNFSANEKVVQFQKNQRYLLISDDKGGIKGYFPLNENSLGKDWFAMYQKPALWLGQLRLSGEQYSVLFVLFNKLDFSNYLRVSRADIAEALQMQPVHVSRAMKVLKEKGIIVEGPPAGKFKTYRLNPYIAHKGKNREQSIVEFNAAMAAKEKNDLKASNFNPIPDK